MSTWSQNKLLQRFVNFYDNVIFLLKKTYMELLEMCNSSMLKNIRYRILLKRNVPLILIQNNRELKPCFQRACD